MIEIMRLLGLNDPSDLPLGSFLGFSPQITTTGNVEWVYPGNNDVVHGQYLYKPEALDTDFYNFDVTEPGKFSAEIVAQRAANASTLDARIVLLKDVRALGSTTPRWELVAVNDDYFGSDPFLNLDLSTGSYALVVTSEGNQLMLIRPR